VASRDEILALSARAASKNRLESTGLFLVLSILDYFHHLTLQGFWKTGFVHYKIAGAIQKYSIKAIM